MRVLTNFANWFLRLPSSPPAFRGPVQNVWLIPAIARHSQYGPVRMRDVRVLALSHDFHVRVAGVRERFARADCGVQTRQCQQRKHSNAIGVHNVMMYLYVSRACLSSSAHLCARRLFLLRPPSHYRLRHRNL